MGSFTRADSFFGARMLMEVPPELVLHVTVIGPRGVGTVPRAQRSPSVIGATRNWENPGATGRTPSTSFVSSASAPVDHP